MSTENKSKPETQMVIAKKISPTELLVSKFCPKALYLLQWELRYDLQTTLVGVFLFEVRLN